MRNNGKGGMATSRAHYAIICPKCGKPAARMEGSPNGNRYMHYTKKGTVWHTAPPEKQEDENGN